MKKQSGTFWGYPRKDGEVGIRNHVAIIAAMDNSNPIVRRIAQQVNGAVAVCCSYGRGQVGEDYEQHVRIMSGLGSHPNVHSAVVVSLEPKTAWHIAERIEKTGRPVEVIALEDEGTIMATYKGVRAAGKLIAMATEESKVEYPLSELVIGLECGGSDSSSGIIANPVIGLLSDQYIDIGATVILSETVEWMGAEHLLAKRAVTAELGRKIIDAVKWYEDYALSVGIDILGTNPAPDNIAGGLTTIEEKALGAIKKGGSKEIKELVQCGYKPSKKGLILMDAPPPGVENTTAIVAGGAHIVLFATGRGNPIGNPVVPTVKITANPFTMEKLPDNIDVDLSPALTGIETLEEAAARLNLEVGKFINGKFSKTEIFGDLEVSVTRIGFSV
ncbi:UxaA family hydrolase [Candidatus Formimonas warabiya]|uniref:Hydrolase n=1 Tax=Formimonas warabiya TaxID=1761012 RepID=A0A3G1KM34_FORW1|nr:UxaA family hydrolase [Candidatus Formimonas warabiya]ATW23464.1 hydrolase [Candidatus Formimonas warabiya]